LRSAYAWAIERRGHSEVAEYVKQVTGIGDAETGAFLATYLE
jgi:hypothetical protein